MTPLRRLLWFLMAFTAIGGLLLHWRAPLLIFHGRSALAWAGLAALGLLGLSCLLLMMDAARQRVPWTRLLIPMVILMEGLGLAWHGGTSPFWHHLRMGTAATLELALIAFAIRTWARRTHDSALLPEEELSQPVSAFLPPRTARLLALELVVLGGALRFLAGGYRKADPPGSSYHKRCVLGSLLLAIPVLIAADLVALEFLLRGSPILRWCIHLGDAYAILWFAGLWASFRARPHRIEGDAVVLHHGLLGHLSLRKEQILGIVAPRAFKDDWARLADNRKVIQLQAPGPPLLELNLSEPLSPMGLLGPGKPKSRVRIAVDDPESFKAALGLE